MLRYSTPLVVLLSGLLLPHARAGEHAYILDSGAKQLVELDLETGKRVASLPLEGMPSWLDDDGRYVLVLDRGPGEDKEERGWKAAGRSSVTVVDAASLKAIGRVELCSGLSAAAFVADDRVALLCPGYEAKKPKEAQPRELVLVDLATARETGRLALEPGTSWVALSQDRRRLAFVQGLPRKAKFPYPQSKLWLVDLDGPRVAATLETGPATTTESDGERLYLLDRGEPNKNPAKNRNGAIEVVSFADPHLERMDAGRSPVGWFREDNLLGVVSEGPDGGAGELRLLRGGKLVATVPVAPQPAVMGKGKDVFYVVGSADVTIVDAASAQVKGTIPLAGVVSEGDDATEMEVTSDGRRAFVLYGPQHKVAVLDLEKGKAIGVAKTGCGGNKFLNRMMAGLEYGVGLIRIPRFNFGRSGRLLARPDGRYGYALNEETKDVTVIDAETAEAVEKIGGQGARLVLMGGPTIVVLGRDIHLIDASRNAKVEQIELPRFLGMVRSGSSGVALAEGTVLIIDVATGRPRARLTDFVRPTYVEFKEEPPRPAP